MLTPHRVIECLRSTTAMCVAALSLSVLLSACSASTGGAAADAAPAVFAAHVTSPAESLHALTEVPQSEPTLPPQGIYNSCEPYYNLPGCEANDLQAAQGGLKLYIDYLGIVAHASGSNSLQARLTYDASIGLKQIINIKNAALDGLNGTALVTFSQGQEGPGVGLAADCTNGTGPNGSAVTNQQLIQCIAQVAKGYPAWFGWYIYDEPVCPYASIGYCQGSLTPAQDANVPAIAKYIQSIDSHPILGVNVGNGYGASYCTGSCVTQHMTNVFGWLASATTPGTGGDYYPIGCPSGQKPGDCIEHISDLRYDIPAINSVLAATYKPETLVWVEQAFNWAEEGVCSQKVCSFPTEGEMQRMRDVTLRASRESGNPVSAIFWYAQADANCNYNPVSGCNASARWSALTQAVNAPYPK